MSTLSDAQYVFLANRDYGQNRLQGIRLFAAARCNECFGMGQRPSAGFLFPSNQPMSLSINYPSIQIRDASQFRQNRLALFLESERSPSALIVPDGGDVVEIHIPVSAFAVGRVLVEPLGRLRQEDAAYGASEVKLHPFFQNASANCRQGLYSSKPNQPIVSIAANDSFVTEFQDCSQIAPGTWQVPAGIRCIEGTLRIPSHTLLLGWTVNRADFSRETDSQQRCFESAEFDSDFQLRLCGLPYSPIRIGISNARYTKGFDLAQTFDAAGHKRLQFLFGERQFQGLCGTCRRNSRLSGIIMGIAARRFSTCQHYPTGCLPKLASPSWLQCTVPDLREWLGEVQQSLSAKTSVEDFKIPLCCP